jgi:hypothetical protein
VEWEALLPWGNFGWGALIVLVFVLMVRGDLVPRKFHEEVRQDRAKLERSLSIALETNRLLAQNSSLGVHALQSIDREARERAQRPDEPEQREK